MRGIKLSPDRNGFSLVEILLVLTIVSILLSLGAKSLNGVLRASGISEAVGLMQSELSLARQSATVRNREHEVRFYYFARPDSPDPEDAFRAFQVVIRDPELEPSASGYTTPGSGQFNPEVVPVNRIRTLPQGVILVRDEEQSPLLTDPSREDEENAIVLWEDTPATYTYFRFKPGGGTDLDLDTEWHLTLALEEDVASGNLKNIATMRIDPSTGKIKWLRP